MLKSVTVVNYLGESLTMDLRNPEKTGYIITSITGLGPGKATINATEIATNDGGVYNSARLKSRNIVLSIKYLWTKPIETLRQNSYKYFPIKKKVKLVFELDNRTAEIEGYVETNDPNIFSNSEGASISIICPDPNFYSAEGFHENTSFSGITSLFEFPFSNESLTEDLIEFGDIQYKSEQIIRYEGDAEIGIILTIHAIGSAGSVTVYNVDTRETMVLDNDKLAALTGAGISTGDTITISTVRGDKYVRLLRAGVTTNILNTLSKQSSWFQLKKGDNIFAFSTEFGTTNLQFSVANRTIYEGL